VNWRPIPAWAFRHRADLLAALVYSCLAYLSFSALAEYANGHHLFPEPQGGYAFAVAIDGAVLYAFISFRRAPWLASLLLVAGALSSFVLQQWHAANDQHPAVVAGVVPAAMVLVTFAWHRIRDAGWVPDWATEPVVPLSDPPVDPPDPEPVEPSARPNSRVRWSPVDDPRVLELLAAGMNANAIRNELRLGDKKYRHIRNYIKDEQARSVGHRNGDSPGGGS
jgi:hypothetical protein